jgi:ribosomal protein L14E/L6E/L27E
VKASVIHASQQLVICTDSNLHMVDLFRINTNHLNPTNHLNTGNHLNKTSKINKTNNNQANKTNKIDQQTPTHGQDGGLIKFADQQ